MSSNTNPNGRHPTPEGTGTAPAPVTGNVRDLYRAADLTSARAFHGAPLTSTGLQQNGGATELEALVRRQLALLGEDPDRDGLIDTPARVARSLIWLTRGYAMTVEEAVGGAVFEESHQNMVMVRDIEMYSMCEHHLLPFFGKVHIAYIPNGRIVGLSKLPRVVEVFARRLQVQERLTDQVADAIEAVLQPRGVGVVVEAVHLCMMMRGVEKQNSRTITSALRGEFRTCPMTREEFLRLAHAG